ncbi:hypothetical protein SEPCBS119000_004480 [Sporothrix epigloea]|uniref:DUF7053 domain-containing protein n=1 Tax=Sporothrix epigloea TaxID=1892477 RepID=A0ABP0DW36_9PEZI
MTSMLRKKELVTIITPIPGFIPRQLAIDILHSHSEVITLNPLVLEHKPIKAPRDASSDEYYSTWYEILERIQYVPGLGRLGSGKLAFNGCFHDMPWGLQAHIYAPMNTDLKYKYRIAGNQPGIEPPETLEMGLAALGAPSDGLYLREDVEVKCSIAAMSFVRSQLKAASKLMVQRIIKKAELIDAGQLRAMLENGRLKTINPADRSTPAVAASPASPSSPVVPASSQVKDASNQSSPKRRADPPGYPPPLPYQIPRPQSTRPPSVPPPLSSAGLQPPHEFRPESPGVSWHQAPQQPPGSPGLGVHPAFRSSPPNLPNPPYPGHPGNPSYTPGPGQASYSSSPAGGYPQMQQLYQQQQMHAAMYAHYGQQMPLPPPFYAELQESYLTAQPNLHNGAVEMPGDYYHAVQPRQPLSATATPRTNRDSDILTTGQWSAPLKADSRPASVASGQSVQSGVPAECPKPGVDKSFSSDFDRQAQDKHRLDALKKLDPNAVLSDVKIKQ